MSSMHLALYVTETGSHLGGWRHPDARYVRPLDWNFYKDLARKAERAKIDMLFIADKLAIDDIFESSFKPTISWRPVPQHAEPLTLLAALSGATEKIGLAGTVSATYTEPYTAARMLANIDHLSQGRAGWNLVTSVSDGEARNFGKAQHLAHDPRYEKAAEFIALAKALWDSWESDWEILDKQSGIYGNRDKVHYVDHAGKWFNVKGPLNVPRPPQGHPVLVQAGVSGNFQKIAAENAELIFGVQPSLEKAKEFYRTFKAQVLAVGRDPAHLKVLPGVVPVIGATTKEAQDRARELKDLVLPLAGLTFMSASMNHDLSQYELDQPMPDIYDRITGSKGRFEFVIRKAVSEGMTVAQVGKWYAESHSFFAPVGTATEVATQLAQWYKEQACDGFVVLPPYMPGGADDFLSGVVPELQNMGVFRREYPGTTLRDTLGLPVPRNRHAQSV